MKNNNGTKKASKGDKKAAKAKARRFSPKITKSKGHRNRSSLAEYMRTGIKRYACTGS